MPLVHPSLCPVLLHPWHGDNSWLEFCSQRAGKRCRVRSRLSFPPWQEPSVMLHMAHISCHLSSLPALSSSLSIVSPSSTLSPCLFPLQELPGFHAYEVHPFKRREVRPGTEQPSLWHDPRSHPLLHHTQTSRPGCRAPLAAVPCAGADALTDPDPPLDLQSWTVVDMYSKSKMFDRVECHFLYFWGLDYFWWFNTPGA